MPAKPKRPKRPRSPKLPAFKSVENISPGDPFIPYRLFVGFTVRKALLESKLLRPGAKIVWLLLADQCHSSGYDKHKQENLAPLAAMSLAQFKRHFARLVKLDLVHSETAFGRQNFTWLLYHDLFSLCSPLTSLISELAASSEVSEQLAHKRATQRIYQRNLQRSNPEVPITGTSNGASSEANREDQTNNWRNEKTPAAVPITNRLETLGVLKEARGLWDSFGPIERVKRLEQAERPLKQVLHYRQYINEKDHTTAAVARREVERYTKELRGLGFYIPSPEAKGKP